MKTVLTEGAVGKRLAAFALPIMASNLLQQLYHAVDAIVVGRVTGGDALAAVGASNPILFLLISLMIGLGTGSEIIIARRLGEGKEKAAQETVDSMMTAILLLAAVLSAVGYFGAEFLLRLIDTPADILDQSVLYLQYYFLGLVGIAGYNTLNGLIRSSGNSVVPLAILLVSTGMNIILDLILVAGLKAGVVGAAMATALAQGFAFLCCLVYVNNKEGMLRYHPLHSKPNLKVVAEGFRCGIPCSVQQCAVSIGMIVLQIAVNSLGTDAVTAYTVGSKIDSFAGIPIMGMAQVLCIFTSQNLGAGKPQRVEEAKKLSYRWTFAFCLLLVSLFWLADEQITSIFCKEEEVIRMASQYIRILSLAYFLAGYWEIAHGYMRGTGDTLTPMLITLIGNWAARLPLAFLLKQLWGAFGVWCSIPCSWAVAFAMTWFYQKSHWFQRRYQKQVHTAKGGELDAME